jgi:hypothetical protein
MNWNVVGENIVHSIEWIARIGLGICLGLKLAQEVGVI